MSDPDAIVWPDWAHYWTRDKYGLQMFHAVEPKLTPGDLWYSAGQSQPAGRPSFVPVVFKRQ